MATAKLQEFIDHLNREVNNKSIYVWGGQGEKPTPERIKRMETNQTNINRALALYNKRKDKHPNMKQFDCSGLGVYFLYNVKGILKGDMNAQGLRSTCDKITKDQLRKGDWVFRVKDNNAYHIGYVVDDNLNVVEAKGRDDGVVKNGLNAFGSTYWNAFGRPSKYFSDLPSSKKTSSTSSTSSKTNASSTPSSTWTCSRLLKFMTPHMSGEDIRALQKALLLKGFKIGSSGADGIYRSGTEVAVMSFQKSKGLEVDGKAGKITVTALGGKWVG